MRGEAREEVKKIQMLAMNEAALRTKRADGLLGTANDCKQGPSCYNIVVGISCS